MFPYVHIKLAIHGHNVRHPQDPPGLRSFQQPLSRERHQRGQSIPPSGAAVPGHLGRRAQRSGGSDVMQAT